jgi:hypothetical protein
MATAEFDGSLLHDAIVEEIVIDWSSGTLRMPGYVFVDGIRSDARRCTLEWSGLTCVRIDREMPWGPSNSINSAKFEPPNHYAVEMQSGDVIAITAQEFEIVRGDR